MFCRFRLPYPAPKQNDHPSGGRSVLEENQIRESNPFKNDIPAGCRSHQFKNWWPQLFCRLPYPAGDLSGGRSVLEENQIRESNLFSVVSGGRLSERHCIQSPVCYNRYSLQKEGSSFAYEALFPYRRVYLERHAVVCTAGIPGKPVSAAL